MPLRAGQFVSQHQLVSGAASLGVCAAWGRDAGERVSAARRARADGENELSSARDGSAASQKGTDSLQSPSVL